MCKYYLPPLCTEVEASSGGQRFFIDKADKKIKKNYTFFFLMLEKKIISHYHELLHGCRDIGLLNIL